MPSMRTFVQLGRMPLTEVWLALPPESNDGALLGVGATPGSSTAALNRSRPFKGRSVRLRSAMASLTVEVVVSIAASALTVTSCGTDPTFSDRLIAIEAPELRQSLRASVFEISLSLRKPYTFRGASLPGDTD